MSDLDVESLLELAAKVAKPLSQAMDAERGTLTLTKERDDKLSRCNSCERQEARRREVAGWTREQAENYLLGLDDASDESNGHQ